QSNDEAYSVIHDASGNVIITGYFADTVDFDPGPLTYTLAGVNGSVFISKLDVNGDFVWAKEIGNNVSVYSHALCLDKSKNVYVSGYFNYTVDFDPGPTSYTLSSGLGDDAFMLKLDPNGNFVWAKQFAANYPYFCIARSMKSDKDNNLFILCDFEGTVNLDPGINNISVISNSISDILVSKLDSNGVFIWAKHMGGTLSDKARSIDVAKDGSIYSTGSFNGTCDYDPGSGVSNITSNGGTDIFIHKLAPTTIGIDEIHIKNHLSVFPNPVSDFLYIKEPYNFNINDVILYNNLGRQILLKKSIENNKIDVRSIPEGFYLLEIIFDNKSFFDKILIAR
ncbi:MAG TPA: T9SS type A sorting domain-containing protein, partial [Bacteroidia bacterium]|nr:T9SS type A sorting domain-containing protein [Bacteroidia bacterium]